MRLKIFLKKTTWEKGEAKKLWHSPIFNDCKNSKFKNSKTQNFEYLVYKYHVDAEINFFRHEYECLIQDFEATRHFNGSERHLV
jgi:hypothetical protein